MITNIKGKAIIKALEKDGFEFKLTSGSHHVYKHQDGRRVVVAYHHPGEKIPPGTLASIIDDAGWPDQDLIRLRLKK